MSRHYLKSYLFDWEVIDSVLSGRSPIDSNFFVTELASKDIINRFLMGYGLNPSDPITRAELFGNFQEALQFIKRYCLKEGNDEGLELKIPNSIYMITDIDDLFLMATRKNSQEVSQREDAMWAEILLKFMHTILHMDKDLRTDYFSTIQTQIFDRFYKHIYRDESTNKLYLGHREEGRTKINLIDFQTKAKKSRDSVLIKLLHKAENVAEELFDRVGIRFITQNKFDSLCVVKFLLENNVIIPHNIKPSRSMNTLVDITRFKTEYTEMLKRAIREEWKEVDFLRGAEKIISDCFNIPTKSDKNEHSADTYRAIHFTGRNLIKYQNPFYYEFQELRKLAKSSEENEIRRKILSLDTSLISREVKFFYPFEVQILDVDSHNNNTQGEASHAEYKKHQLRTVIKRLFREIIKVKKIQYI
jgi:uncharacterized protein (TIGR04562 family)